MVDLGRGDERTRYVAVANTVIGVALLSTGALGAAISEIGPVWYLGALAFAGLVGAVVALRMTEIEG